MDLVYSFVICITMYSIIPMPMLDWTEKKMRFSFCFFPLIGAIIGGLWYLSYQFLAEFNSSFSAVILLLIPIIISGGIHLDGLIDTCDAVFSYGDREKKLEILKDPRTGAFGVIGAVSYFFAVFAVNCQIIENNKFINIIPFLFVISRCVGAICMLCVKNARKNGLGATFSDASNKITLVALFAWLTVAFVFIFTINFALSLAILLVTALFLLIYLSYIKKQFGGITGDLTGFIISFLELLLALTVAVGGVLL